MARRKKAELEDERELKLNPVNVFTCDCGKANEVSQSDFLKHLNEAHGLDANKVSGKRKMLAHMDGSYWYSYNWSWELESGLKFSQYTRQARSHDDPMRFWNPFKQIAFYERRFWMDW